MIYYRNGLRSVTIEGGAYVAWYGRQCLGRYARPGAAIAACEDGGEADLAALRFETERRRKAWDAARGAREQAAWYDTAGELT